VSYAGYAFGAALSWNSKSDVDLPRALDAFAFGDASGIMGKLAYDLGNTYKEPGVIVRNGNLLHWIYTTPIEKMRQGWRRSLEGESGDVLANNSLLYENLYGTLEYVDNVMQPLGQAKIARPDADLIKREFEQSARMLKHGAMRALFELGDEKLSKAELLADLDALIEEQKALWLARNRPGGLSDSLKALEAARDLYR
jgi:hypothetical protein